MKSSHTQFENKAEVMGSKELGVHRGAFEGVRDAKREIELRGSFHATAGGGADFLRRTPVGKVYFLRGWFWTKYPSVSDALWAADRLAVIKDPLAGDVLKAIVMDAEARLKKKPENWSLKHSYLPRARMALRLHGLVRKHGSPALALKPLLSEDALKEEKLYAFLSYALEVTFNVAIEDGKHLLDVLSQLDSAVKTADEEAGKAKEDAVRVVLERKRGLLKDRRLIYVKAKRFPGSISLGNR